MKLKQIRFHCIALKPPTTGQNPCFSVELPNSESGKSRYDGGTVRDFNVQVLGTGLP